MARPGPLLLATANPHKIEELRAIFNRAGIDVASLNDLGAELPEPREDQPTFIGNAQLKARYYARATGRLCVADDSGLVVDALGGAPGVYSARYAGVDGDRARRDAANNRKLIEALHGVPDARRTARYECVMALCDPDRTWAATRGSLEGRIVDQPRGDNGFGYDPYFFLPERGRRVAELSPDDKNAISHRARATRALVRALGELGGPGDTGKLCGL